MKKKLIVICILLTSIANAQTPTWVWAKHAGGASDEGAQAMAVDAAGNSFVAGWFNDTTLTLGTFTLNNSHAGTSEIFLAKFDPTGNVIWATAPTCTVGASNFAEGVALDAAGNCYLTGAYYSGTITFGTSTLPNVGPGKDDIFIAKYDPNGNPLWAKRAGGTDFDAATSIAVDAAGNSYITGFFSTSVILFGTHPVTNSGPGTTIEIFLAKYAPNGNVIWAISEGGTSGDEGLGVALGGNNKVYICGVFNSSPCTVGTTALPLTNSFFSDMLVAQYDTAGNNIWAKSAGGTNDDAADVLAADALGNVYVETDYFSSSILFGTTTLTNGGPTTTRDIALTKYDNSGNVLWAKTTGGSDDDIGQSLKVDATGNPYLAGSFGTYIINFGTTNLLNAWATKYDIYIVKFRASNGNEIGAIAAGGTDYEEAKALGLDAANNCFVAGHTVSPTIQFGTTTLTNLGSADIYLAKLSMPLGITEENDETGFSIYPNPSSGIFFVSSEKEITKIEVYNMLGELIHSKINSKTIDLTDSQAGIYFVKIACADEIVTKKVVKE